MVFGRPERRPVAAMLLALVLGQSTLFGLGYRLWEWAGLPLPGEVEVGTLLHALLPLWHLRHLVPLFVLSALVGAPPLRYSVRADWRAPIAFPLIWRGTEMPLYQFFGIAMVNVGIAFSVMLWTGGTARPVTITYLVMVMLWALANGFMEEYIWRGFVQSRLCDVVGEQWAVILAAVGFGLWHVVYGVPDGWDGAIGLALGSFLVGGMVARSRGMVPAILWHAYMDVWVILLAG